MVIDHPTPEQTRQLLALWKDAFGDHEGFWELFLDSGFSPERCRCVTENGQVAAGLCWFDCGWSEETLAYLYAVVTHPDFRGRGLCRALMEDTHALLKGMDYGGVLLVPETESLRKMYEKLGYQNRTGVSEFPCAAGTEAVPIRAICGEEYARLRREYLPEGGVVQEGANLDFLSRQAQLFAGHDFLLAAYSEDGVLHGMELLGNAEAAPGILHALGFSRGVFRAPGSHKAFAMFHPLTNHVDLPVYFGLAFD